MRDAGDEGHLANRFAWMDEAQAGGRACLAELDRQAAGAKEIELVGLIAGLEKRHAAGQTEADSLASGGLAIE
jgi:hypothetical protein